MSGINCMILTTDLYDSERVQSQPKEFIEWLEQIDGETIELPINPKIGDKIALSEWNVELGINSDIIYNSITDLYPIIVSDITIGWKSLNIYLKFGE